MLFCTFFSFLLYTDNSKSTLHNKPNSCYEKTQEGKQMCIQRHPCRYKCFENYSALYNSFPVQNSSPCNCFKKQKPCGCGQNSGISINYGDLNYFNNPCPPTKQNKFNFCIQGTLKLSGSC